MPATPQRIDMTPEEVEKARGGTGGYANLEPGEYAAILKDVEDYKTERSTGWKWTYEVEGLPFSVWTAFSPEARWKLIETIEGFEPAFFSDGGSLGDLDPNVFIGMECMAEINWDIPDKKWDGKADRFKELKATWPITGREVAQDMELL